MSNVMSEKETVTYIRNLIDASFAALSGVINTRIPCHGYTVCNVVENLNLDCGMAAYGVYASTGINQININTSAIFNRATVIHKYNKRDIKSLIISIVSHELSHLDQDTNKYHYMDKDNPELFIEQQNVLNHTTRLIEKYDELKEILGPFDPKYDIKNSDYMYYRYQATAKEARGMKIVSGEHQNLINFIESMYDVDFDKIKKKYKSIRHIYTTEKGKVLNSSADVPMEAFDDPKIIENYCLINSLITSIDSTASEVYNTTYIGPDRTNEENFLIETVYDKFTTDTARFKTFYTKVILGDDDVLNPYA